MRGYLHHVEIYVSDLARSKTFWGWLLQERLGYSIYQDWDHGISWKLGATYLVFVQRKEKYASYQFHRCGVGLNHLAFHVGSREEVEAITSEARERGISILYEDRYPSSRDHSWYAAYFEDPDRIKVELVAPD